jgi:hypothetical protein
MSTSVPLAKRIAVFVRDRGACVYCGARYQDGAHLTVDHVVSRKRGGGDEYENLVTACLPCNQDKAHFGMKAYVVELQDRGRDTTGLAERVEAACLAPIDWVAVKRASDELKAMAKAAEDDDD